MSSRWRPVPHIQYIAYSKQCTVYSKQYTVQSIQYKLNSIQYKVYRIHYTVYTPSSSLLSPGHRSGITVHPQPRPAVYCTILYTVYSLLYTVPTISSCIILTRMIPNFCSLHSTKTQNKQEHTLP